MKKKYYIEHHADRWWLRESTQGREICEITDQSQNLMEVGPEELLDTLTTVLDYLSSLVQDNDVDSDNHPSRPIVAELVELMDKLGKEVAPLPLQCGCGRLANDCRVLDGHDQHGDRQ